MLTLNALGSEFKVEYHGEEYNIEYSFPTAPQISKYSFISSDGMLHTDVHGLAKELIQSIEGLKLKIEDDKKLFGFTIKQGESVVIDSAKKLYSYPLYELQSIVATELQVDMQKKFKVTGTE